MFFHNISFYLYLILGIIIFRKLKNNNNEIIFLIIYSSIFYIINDYSSYILLFFSIVFNYIFIIFLKEGYKHKFFLFFPILINIILILNFKYILPLLNNVNIEYNLKNIYIPLGLSFFTFQQISFIFDFYEKKINKIKFDEYFLYIIFFPQLVAGPIVKFKQVSSYFRNLCWHVDYHASFSFIIIGLFKKIVIADSLGYYSDLFFNSLDSTVLSFFEAWTAVLLFSFQIYFDFSAYSDLAIGIALLFGVKLPENFYSPYKAINIIEFWRRWHISLSQFIKDYLYIKLGGSRRGVLFKHFNIIFSMTICGAWHGTGVNFLIWGLYNGFFLSLNHQLKNFNFKIYHFFSWLITFVIVVIGFAIFRSNSFENLMSLFKSLFLFNNLSLPVSFAALIPNLNNIQFDGIYPNNLVDFKIVFLLILIVIFITFFCENSQNIVGKQFFVQYGNYSPQKSIVRIFKDKKYFDFFLGILLLICSLFYSTDIQNFIYFVF